MPSDFTLSAALLVVWLQLTLRGLTGRGLLYWTIHSMIAMYAACLLIGRCLRYGWYNLPARFDTELASTRATFMTLAEYRRAKPMFRPAQ